MISSPYSNEFWKLLEEGEEEQEDAHFYEAPNHNQRPHLSGPLAIANLISKNQEKVDPKQK